MIIRSNKNKSSDWRFLFSCEETGETAVEVPTTETYVPTPTDESLAAKIVQFQQKAGMRKLYVS